MPSCHGRGGAVGEVDLDADAAAWACEADVEVGIGYVGEGCRYGSSGTGTDVGGADVVVRAWCEHDVLLPVQDGTGKEAAKEDRHAAEACTGKGSHVLILFLNDPEIR